MEHGRSIVGNSSSIVLRRVCAVGEGVIKMYDAPMFAPQGWQCPVCGRVYAPSWPFCTVCGNQEAVTTTNVTTSVDKPIDELVKEWKEMLKKAQIEPWYINSMLGEPYGADKEDDDGLSDQPEGNP